MITFLLYENSFIYRKTGGWMVGPLPSTTRPIIIIKDNSKFPLRFLVLVGDSEILLVGGYL